jgi:hypothetical protein
MISLLLALSLRLAPAPPPVEPVEPVEVAPIAVPEPPSVPEPEPTPTPPLHAGSVAITLVGPLDPDTLAAAITVRLSPLGLSPSFDISRDFSPRIGPAPEDRVAEIWVLSSASELRVVIADPSHAHTIVRTLPIDDPSKVMSLADTTATFIEEGLVLALAGTWPASEPLPSVVVEAPVSQPEPVTPEPEPSRPARGNHPRGIVLGVSGGIAYVRDELENVFFGIPTLVRLGYVFGHNRRYPDLRASLEARVGSLAVPHSATKLTLVQVLAESRIGFTRGPVWMFGIVGIGSGVYTRRRGGEAFRETDGVMGTLGVGASVRITRFLAIHCDGVASGNPGLVGRLGFDLGLTGYIDLPRKGRGR